MNAETLSDETGTAHNVAAPEFYIPAQATLEAPPHVLKHGNTFALFDRHGDVLASGKKTGGIFHDDTRHLSGLYLTLDGYRPLILSSRIEGDGVVLTVDLANPDIMRDGAIALCKDTLHLIRTKFLWQGGCHERICIQNFGLQSHQGRLGLRFAADFADLFEVRGIHRQLHGQCSADNSSSAVFFRYAGLDGVERITTIQFDPAPAQLDTHQAFFDYEIGPLQRWVGFVCYEFRSNSQPENFGPALRAARRAIRQKKEKSAGIESSNGIFNEVLDRAISDISMLVTDTPEGPYPYAGIPWFSTAFGRDGIITALEMLWLNPDLAKGVLKFLAATQAKKLDPASDAEPGKILHETRQGEMARTGEVPFGLYYGSVDATPLFVLLASEYHRRTGDLETIRNIWPNIEAALNWIDKYGDQDGDGFVEYHCMSANGLVNQGWKDSQDSVMHEDGALAQGAIALCEVQAYVYAAKHGAANLASVLGNDALAQKLKREAEELKHKFETAFWCDDLSIYALALDGDKKPCRVVSSNAGHALFGGIASPERAIRTGQTLLRAESWSGWGVRTLAACERRYNPMSYHNGSIWPHDNALIALGCSRYGLGRSLEIFSGMFEAARLMDALRLPELFCGFRRRNGAPTLYPVACSPQAWSSAAPLALLQACLGLSCDGVAREVRFEQPRLPDWIDRLCIRKLRVADGAVDLCLERNRDTVSVDATACSGGIRIEVT